MVYGFNDNKEKIEVYSKSDFVVITKTSSNVAAGTETFATIYNSDLVAAGINPADINKYAVISVEQKLGTGSFHSGIIGSTNVLPRVVRIIESSPQNNYMRAYVKNTSESTNNVTVRVVLLKVE